MDDPRMASGAGSPNVPGPQWRRDPAEGPEAFVPLWLRLEASGAAVELSDPDMVVGRHSGADLRLPLPDVSRRHCRFSFREGQWWLYDLNSLNGVFVNGERIEHAPVRPGDTVRIGGFTFTVEVPTTGERGPTRSVLRSIAEALPRGTDATHRQRWAS
jgi:pSer/pThr/pTyr-binding forkhead associated (FHA) protein